MNASHGSAFKLCYVTCAIVSLLTLVVLVGAWFRQQQAAKTFLDSQKQWIQAQQHWQAQQQQQQAEAFYQHYVAQQRTLPWLNAPFLRQLQAWQSQYALPHLHYQAMPDNTQTSTLPTPEGVVRQRWQIRLPDAHEGDMLRWLQLLQSHYAGSLLVHSCAWTLTNQTTLETHCDLDWWYVPTAVQTQ